MPSNHTCNTASNVTECWRTIPLQFSIQYVRSTVVYLERMDRFVTAMLTKCRQKAATAAAAPTTTANLAHWPDGSEPH